jgi:hypothetical protein
MPIELQFAEQGFPESHGWTAHVHKGQGAVNGAIWSHKTQLGVNAIAIEDEGRDACSG